MVVILAGDSPRGSYPGGECSGGRCPDTLLNKAKFIIHLNKL